MVDGLHRDGRDTEQQLELQVDSGIFTIRNERYIGGIDLKLSMGHSAIGNGLFLVCECNRVPRVCDSNRTSYSS